MNEFDDLMKTNRCLLWLPEWFDYYNKKYLNTMWWIHSDQDLSYIERRKTYYQSYKFEYTTNYSSITINMAFRVQLSKASKSQISFILPNSVIGYANSLSVFFKTFEELENEYNLNLDKQCMHNKRAFETRVKVRPHLVWEEPV